MPRTPAKRKAKEPTNGNYQEQNDEDKQETPAKTGETPEMRLRSGKKKRRRSKETSGLTPTASAKKRKRTGEKAAKRARTSADDDMLVDEKKQEDEDMQDSDDEMEDAQGSDKSKDESSESEAESEQEEEDKKMPAVENGPPAKAASASTKASSRRTNGRAATAKGAAGSSKKKVPPIANLRLPSQQAAGKASPAAARQQAQQQQQEESSTVEDYIASVSVSKRKPPPAAAAAAQDEQPSPPPEVNRVTHDSRPLPEAVSEMEYIMAAVPEPQEPLHRRLARQASDSFFTMVTTVQEVSESIILPSRIGFGGVVAEAAEENAEPIEYKALFSRIEVWLIVILLLQLFFWPIWINPILTSVMEVSEGSVRLYKGILGIRPVANITSIQAEPLVAQDDSSAAEELASVLSAFDENLSEFGSSRLQFQKQLGRTGNGLRTTMDEMYDLDAAMKQVESTLNSIMASGTGSPAYIPSLVARALDEIDKLSSDLESSSLTGIFDAEKLIETGSEPLWRQAAADSPSACAPTSKNSLVSPDRLAVVEGDLREVAQSSFSLVSTDPALSDVAKKWARAQIVELLRQTSPEKRATRTLTTGMTEFDARDVIQNRLEQDLADQTGLIDYASIHAGASVIRSGPRATSPSLVDSFPLLNRIMQQTNLRFYGFGPEAALTPTQPVDALGQCWAFQDVSKSTRTKWRDAHQTDKTNGEYGTLSVRLAKPIQVTQVVMEHIPADLTSQPDSAVSHFRLYGYSDENAAGQPVDLGEFYFDLDASKTMIEFEINPEHRETPFHSVTLAIDENHGFDYTCLYRFRVHGNE